MVVAMRLIETETGEQYPVLYRRITSRKVRLTVTDNDNCVATFQWFDDTGEIDKVRVEPKYRRKGIATGLLRIANTYMPIKHSAYRSPEGNIWAESTGDYLPPLKRD
jgi:ribosomal protein S18 acetylase RimI-like enzyme